MAQALPQAVMGCKAQTMVKSASIPAAQAGLMLLLLGSLLDSSSGLFTRLITADSFATAAGRGFAAFGFLLIIMAFRDGRATFGKLAGIGPYGWAFVALNGIGMVLNVLSLRYTAVANFFMIFATAPFAAGLLGWIVLKEKLDGPTIVAALAGFAGIAIMMLGGARSGGLIGDLMAIGCVFTYSCIVLIARRAPRFDLLPVITLTCLMSGLLSAPFADFTSVTLDDGLKLAAFGSIQLAIGNLCIFAAASRIPPAQSGLLGVFNAGFAPLWVFFALGEVPPEATLIGGALVMAAAIGHLIYTLAPRRALRGA